MDTNIFIWQDYIELNADLDIKTEIEAKEHWNNIGFNQLRLCNKKQLIVRNEFGNELVLFIPYYYYLYINNLLFDNKIYTYFGMRPYYFFVKPENIIERNEIRSYTHPSNNFLLINNLEYVMHFNKKFWIPPPYISIYKNNIVEHDKPLLIIHNKYNIEWDIMAYNYIDVQTLDKILSLLVDKYQIIYIRQSNNVINKGFSIDSNAVLNDLEDYQLIKQKYSNVLLFNDILEKNNYSYNELVVKVFSDCTDYISVQGGNSYLISYFAKKMAIYHKVGDEIASNYNAYEGWFTYMNEYEKNILVSDDYNSFIDNIIKLYL